MTAAFFAFIISRKQCGFWYTCQAYLKADYFVNKKQQQQKHAQNT